MNAETKLISNKVDIVPKLDYSLCGFSPVHGDKIAVFDIYIDESGTHDDKGLVIAGYVAQAEKWAVFSQEWKRILTDYSVPYFHTKDFRNLKSRIYRNLTVGDKQNLLGALVDIIQRHILFGVAFACSPRVYKRLTTATYRSRHGSCYNLTIQGCLWMVFGKIQPLESRTETVGIFVEDGHKNAREIMEILQDFKRQSDPQETPDDLDGVFYGGPLEVHRDIFSGREDPLHKNGIKIGTYGLGSKKTMLPLQAADLFAYCAYGLGRRQNVHFCKRIMDSLQKRVPHFGFMCNEKFLQGVIENTNKDVALRTKQKRDYYLLGKQLRACGFEVEQVRDGFSIRGSKAKMAAFAMINGMKHVAGD